MLESPMSPGQCRAARAYLGMTRLELASAAGLTDTTVVSFERGLRTPHHHNIAALRAVLESKGIDFLALEDGKDGLLLPFDIKFPPDKED